ncbi:hypothetical protein CAOG_002659 [Capsaspora owczarzaki ATCC 30864]|uniref:PWI domain-containing protein n=1 Tax=Capsaspora owczarzaki (strain ATCC 30864) TaxID=595528 RepID=A0A0D2U8Y8_CAPO3|nr:hypothetical protein CAOG_002659 [Capsaspora owczarzaki ATCC 30864]
MRRVCVRVCERVSWTEGTRCSIFVLFDGSLFVSPFARCSHPSLIFLVLQFPDPRKMQLNLTGFLEGNTPDFMLELWKLLLSAQSSPGGVPQQLIEQKKQEILQRKVEMQRLQEAIKAKALATAASTVEEKPTLDLSIRAPASGTSEPSRERQPSPSHRRRSASPRRHRSRSRSPKRRSQRSRSRSRSPKRRSRHSRSRSRSRSRSPKKRQSRRSRSRSRSRSPRRRSHVHDRARDRLVAAATDRALVHDRPLPDATVVTRSRGIRPVDHTVTALPRSRSRSPGHDRKRSSSSRKSESTETAPSTESEPVDATASAAATEETPAAAPMDATE